MIASPPSDARYERKFVFSIHEHQALLLLLQLHPAAFREVYPTRHINNIYFDTQFGSCYEDNIEGAPYRVKCRVRWYGALHGRIANPTLEFKIKRGMVGTKRTVKLPPFHWDGTATHETLRRVFAQSELPMDITETLATLQPTSVNRYLRSYHANSDDTFRITLDSQLTYMKPEQTVLVSERSDDLIVELKYDASHARQAAAISQFLGARLSRNSKYVQGCEAL